MKNIKRIIALILALVIGASVCFCGNVSAAEEPKNLIEYKQMLDKEGYPALTTEQFMGAVKKINTAYRTLTGRGDIPQEHFNFVADEILTELCGYMAEETGLDLMMMLTRLPETNGFPEFVTETFDIDPAVIRNVFYQKRAEFDSRGQGFPALLMHFLGVYFGIIDECKAYCAPYDEWGDDWYEIHLCLTLRDGTTEDVGTGIMLNTVSGEVRSKEGNGVLATGYDFSASELLLYAQVNVWMRDFGFTFFYDWFCYTTPFFFYNTRRIKFDYAGKEWMIQVWKGNYLVSNGAEVGIYNRAPEKFGTYYDCAGDEDMLNMSMKLYHGDDLLFERPEQLHWWLTGFQLSDTLYPAETLTLDFAIEMKDEEMLNAFCEAIEKHYRKDMTYTVDGLTVNVIW